MNQDTQSDGKKYLKSGLIFILPLLLIFIVVSTNCFTQGLLLKRSNRVIAMKMAAVQAFVEEASFAEEIVLKASENRAMSIDKIHQSDRKWIHHPADSTLLSQLLKNELSRKLGQFQRDNPVFKEIFITDSLGLVIALTNPTSDYYQADEDWWNRTLEQGNYVGGIDYDESAESTLRGLSANSKCRRRGHWHLEGGFGCLRCPQNRRDIGAAWTKLKPFNSRLSAIS